MYVVRLFLVVCAVFISVVTKEASGGTVVSGEITDSLNTDEYGNSIKQLSSDYDCGCGFDSYCEIDKIETRCTCFVDFKFYNGSSENKCSETEPCPNEGQCLDDVCQCPNGKDGEFCEIGEYCNGLCDGMVGDGLIGVYNATSKKAYCICRGKEKTIHTFHDHSQNCSFCYCGTHSFKCSFEFGKKNCTCLDGYADRLGKCTKCDCGPKGKCSFNSLGDKICHCEEGYSQQSGTCIKILQTSSIPTTFIPTPSSCDCGVKSYDCKLDYQGRKICSCMPGYAQNVDMCYECDCGSNGKCRLEDRGLKTCDCEPGYAENKYLGKCMEICDERKCNNGVCVETRFNFKCICYQGFTGVRCNERIIQTDVSIAFIVVFIVLCVAIVGFFIGTLCLVRRNRNLQKKIHL